MKIVVGEEKKKNSESLLPGTYRFGHNTAYDKMKKNTKKPTPSMIQRKERPVEVDMIRS